MPLAAGEALQGLPVAFLQVEERSRLGAVPGLEGVSWKAALRPAMEASNRKPAWSSPQASSRSSYCYSCFRGGDWLCPPGLGLTGALGCPWPERIVPVSAQGK